MARTLLISEEYIRENSVISNNVEYGLLKHLIYAVQDFKLKEVIGSDLFDEIMLQGSTTPDTFSTDNKKLCDEYILPFLNWHLMAECCLSLKFKFTNVGVMENRTDNSDASATSDLQIIAKRYRTVADGYGQKMIDYIRGNLTKFPKYLTNSGVDKTQPVRSANYAGGLYLDDREYYPCNCNGLCYCK